MQQRTAELDRPMTPPAANSSDHDMRKRMSENLRLGRWLADDMSQKQLEALSKVPREWISTYENEHRVPHLVTLRKLAKALERDPGWFYTPHPDLVAEMRAALATQRRRKEKIKR